MAAATLTEEGHIVAHVVVEQRDDVKL